MANSLHHFNQDLNSGRCNSVVVHDQYGWFSCFHYDENTKFSGGSPVVGVLLQAPHFPVVAVKFNH
jgi:hypothetical protein